MAGTPHTFTLAGRSLNEGPVLLGKLSVHDSFGILHSTVYLCCCLVQVRQHPVGTGRPAGALRPHCARLDEAHTAVPPRLASRRPLCCGCRARSTGCM